MRLNHALLALMVTMGVAAADEPVEESQFGGFRADLSVSGLTYSHESTSPSPAEQGQDLLALSETTKLIEASRHNELQWVDVAALERE